MSETASLLQRKLDEIISDAEQLHIGGIETPYLDHIIASLRDIREELQFRRPNRQQRRRATGGIFRLVSEDQSFLQSRLGARIVEVLNEYNVVQPD